MASKIQESPGGGGLGVPVAESPLLSRLSTLTHYSPRPRDSDLFPSCSTPNDKNMTSIQGRMSIARTVQILNKSNGSITVRLYESYDKYFSSTSVDSKKQFRIETIVIDNQYGADFAQTGIQNGWILTKIGHDEDATKLMYNIAKNRLLNLAKIGKKSGYSVTFEGEENNYNQDDDDDEKKPKILHSMSTSNNSVGNASHIFIDDDNDLGPILPEFENEDKKIENDNNNNNDKNKSKIKKSNDKYIEIDRGYLIVSMRLYLGHIMAYKFQKYLKDENITDEMLSYDLYKTKYSWSLCEHFLSEIMEYDEKKGKAVFEFMKKEALLTEQ